MSYFWFGVNYYLRQVCKQRTRQPGSNSAFMKSKHRGGARFYLASVGQDRFLSIGPPP